jgi:hypothetical protein
VVGGTSDAIYLKDRQGRYLLANPGHKQALSARPSIDILGSR